MSSTSSTVPAAVAPPVAASDRWTSLQRHRADDLHSRLGVRHLRSHHHAARHAAPHQGMGDHAGDDGHGDHDLALDRSHRHVRFPGVCRSLRPQARADLGDSGIFGLHRPHRLFDRLGQPLDLQLDHPDRARRREPGRHADGHRDRADQMARDRLGRPGRRLPVRLHAVLGRGACRRAALGMALALLPRHHSGAARALDPHRHQGKPALRARHRADAQAGAEEAARHPVAGAPIPARNADRVAGLLLLSVHLARMVGVDAVLSGHREATRLPDHGLLPHDLDGLRDLRLLVLRLAVRSVRTPLGDPVLRRPGRHSPGR